MNNNQNSNLNLDTTPKIVDLTTEQTQVSAPQSFNQMNAQPSQVSAAPSFNQMNAQPEVMNDSYGYQNQFYGGISDINQLNQPKKRKTGLIVGLIISLIAGLILIGGGTAYFIDQSNKEKQIAVVKKEGEEFVAAASKISQSRKELVSILQKFNPNVSTISEELDKVVNKVIDDCNEVGKLNFTGKEANVEKEVTEIKKNAKTVAADYTSILNNRVADNSGDDLYNILLEIDKNRLIVEETIKKI